jgi:hypothetical protein
MALGDQLVGTGSRNDAGLAAAVAGWSIAVAANTAAIGTYLDLQQATVFGAREGSERLAALRTVLLAGRQFPLFDHDGEMAVVPAWRTGPPTLLAARTWWVRRGNGHGAIRLYGDALGLAAKQLAFPQPQLGLEIFVFGLEFGESRDSPLMHGFPVAGLLSEFEILRQQGANRTRGGQRRVGRGACVGSG